VAETLWNGVRGWLIAGMLINLASVVSGFVSDRIGEPAWLTAVGFGCVLAAFACLVVVFVRWRRYRAAERAHAERAGEWGVEQASE
jgi:hypothetical protein